MQPSPPLEEHPGLEGSDYLALVIEWDDAPTLVWNRAPDRATITRHKIIAVLGALGVIAFAAWGIHRLRAAS